MLILKKLLKSDKFELLIFFICGLSEVIKDELITKSSFITLFFLLFFDLKLNLLYEINKITEAIPIQISLLYNRSPIKEGLRVFFSSGV